MPRRIRQISAACYWIGSQLYQGCHAGLDPAPAPGLDSGFRRNGEFWHV